MRCVPTAKIGDTVICAETGKPFTVSQQGCSYNYGIDAAGKILSLEGCEIRDKRELLDRSRPFTGYLSSDGKRFTNRPGATLGHVTRETTSTNGFGRSRITHVHVRDVHGNYWHGQGAGRGMILTLRPMADPNAKPRAEGPGIARYRELGARRFRAGVEQITFTGRDWRSRSMAEGYQDERQWWVSQCGPDTLARGPYVLIPGSAQ